MFIQVVLMVALLSVPSFGQVQIYLEDNYVQLALCWHYMFLHQVL